MSRIATRPLNTQAVRDANDDFYRNHPEMVQDGRRIPLDPCNPDHDDMRREWMDSYIDHGGEVRRGTYTPDCDDPVHTCPETPEASVTLEIVDRKTGAVVSGAAPDIIVGQKAELQVRTNPAGQTMTNIRWNIPGENVKNYTQSTTAGTKTDLAATDLQAANIDFYWISGGNKQVQVSATVSGSNLSNSVNYNVLTPINITMTSVTGTVAVGNPGFPGAGLEIHYGTNTTPGISWTLRCTAPADGSGEIAGTQLINTHRTRTTNAGATQSFSSGGVFQLDNSVPYSAAVAIASGASATWTSDDSPGSPLTSDLREKTTGDSFKIYFMYKPSGADSIWVTLMRMNWNWGGKTTRVGAPAGTGNTWNAPTNVSNNRNPTGSASTELPTWTANFTSLTWR